MTRSVWKAGSRLPHQVILLLPRTLMEHPSVVLDTNVFVAAGFRPDSDSARVLQLVRDGAVRLRWDEATYRETEHIVRKIPPLPWDRVRDVFRAEDRYEGTTDPASFAHVPDPDDRKFAALAAAVGAVLVSMDEHLLAGRAESPVSILTPGEFVKSRGRS